MDFAVAVPTGRFAAQRREAGESAPLICLWAFNRLGMDKTHLHVPLTCSLLFGCLRTQNIGAPRFELGTSPTRTARATRLRHAPTQDSVSHTSLAAVPSACSRGVSASHEEPREH
jgi:hypothetical protein